MLSTYEIGNLEHSKQSDRLYRLMGMELVLGGLSAVAAVIGLWDNPEHDRILPWLIVLGFVYAGRYALGWAYQRRYLQFEAPSQWQVIFFIGLGISGALWGILGVMAATQIQPFPQPMGLFLVWIVCLSFLVLAIYLESLNTLIAFAVPALIPPLFVLLHRGGQIDGSISSILFLFFVILALSATRLQRSVKSFLALEGTNRKLQSLLDASQHQVESLTTTIKANASENEKLGKTLSLVSADLGHARTQAKTLSEALERVSLYCPVTGIPNRRLFDDVLQMEWRRLMRDKKPLSLILANLDDADQAIDFYTSDGGANCLQTIANVLKSYGRRGGDLLARYGATQFCLLLIGADTKHAIEIAESLRQHLAAQKITHEGLQPGDFVTIHIGTTTMIPSRWNSQQEAIKRIESALYEAKFQGGDRVIAYRALDWLRLERWNIQTEGPLCEENLLRKLRTWEFEPRKRVYQSGVVILDQSPDKESINAVLHGQLRLTIEGQSVVLKPGDCVFLPRGTTYSSEVIGEEPAVVFDSAPRKRHQP